VISSLGDAMSDGFLVPDRADGMGCFALDRRRVALVRNHELRANLQAVGPFARTPQGNVPVFDSIPAGAAPGGTTTIVYDLRSGRVESQHLSLVGTIRNCAGGITPWGSWLTCEEDVSRRGDGGLGKDHGWVFEVPARARAPVEPVPLTALGRFNHEAATVDPRTGIVYLTEDREDGLFYRMLPNQRGRLVSGGRLQALALADGALTNTSNWENVQLPQGQWQPVRWVELDHPEAPDGDDLRARGRARGATIFARGEGIWCGRDELYFTCTSGGAAKLGQVMRYRPSRFEGRAGERGEPGRLQNFVESTDPNLLNFADNLTIGANGHLILCEDRYQDDPGNHLRGVTPAGLVYDFGHLHARTELAGACFSPDGRILFVNVYSPARTLAITGPWGSFSA
jgi:secreted PhoX family phosphatase